MNLKLISVLLTTVLLIGSSCSTPPERSYNDGINIIPQPLSLKQVEEAKFTLSGNTSFCVEGDQATVIANFFATKIATATGYDVTVGNRCSSSEISLKIDTNLDAKAEGYTLNVDSDKVAIVGKDAAGLFYGMQSFMQLLPAEIESPIVVENIVWSAPCVEIADQPRFEYRGIMLDACRHFMPVDFVKKQIDILSLFKINRLHLHLTEDQGWRIEIKKYPKLTEIGSKRIEGEGHEYGGFYTQEDIKEIVAYASERFITIVPEFELPGHELAAIAAYPELSCGNTKTSPRIVWGVEDIVMCPGKEATFQFLEDVITEMAPLFPGEYFHIGGDECPKSSWEKCPLCKKRIRAEKLFAKDGHSSEERLQSYVIGRVEKMLTKHGKKLIGWDEILEGGLSPEATVMSWRGEDGGIAAANMGHNVIMSPNSGGLYIDHYQGDSNIEPVAIGGYSTLSRVYSYNPVPEKLVETGKSDFVMGVQANLWTEYMYTTELMEYRLYPRAIAVAEIGWTQMDRKDLEDFYRRMNNASVRLDNYDVNYHIPQAEQAGGSFNFIPFTADTVTLAFTTTRPIKMEYSINGGATTQYTEPLTFSESSTLEIYSVLPSGKTSPTRVITIEKQESKPSIEVANPLKGLAAKFSDGRFLNTEELSNATTESTTSVIENWSDLLRRGKLQYSSKEVTYYAAEAEGYINIAEDGIYYFSSDNEDVWIDGEIIVDNSNEVKRFSRNVGAIALKAGMHQFKTVFISNIIGGWPTIWSDASVSMKKEGAEKFTIIEPEMLFYTK